MRKSYDETIASGCRYGENAAPLLEGADIFWEDSQDDYQGHADLLAACPDGRFAHVSWLYGSCSGCDTWEETGASDAEITEEMRRDGAFFDNVDDFVSYLTNGPMTRLRQERLDAFNKWRAEGGAR